MTPDSSGGAPSDRTPAGSTQSSSASSGSQSSGGQSSGSQSSGGTASGRLRKDAERNRSRVLGAAREVFSEQGLQAPTVDISRRAGVGIATVYRRFPTRHDLITATFEEKMAAYLRELDAARSDPDPWRAFRAHIERVCGVQVEDRGFAYALTTAFASGGIFEAERDHAYAVFAELVRRAQESGQLRPDFRPEDLPVLLMAHAGVVEPGGKATERAGRRLVAYMLQAFANTHDESLPPVPSAQELHSVIATGGALATGGVIASDDVTASGDAASESTNAPGSSNTPESRNKPGSSNASESDGTARKTDG